jgi:formiminotetrahydrofolate cyclodeaminase
VETLEGYLERLASGDPVPGGGSAAALTGAIAAALVAMVGRIRATPFETVVARADRLRSFLEAARERDERAYAAVVAAQQMPKISDAQKTARRRALDSALTKAAQAPLHSAALCLEVLKLCDRMAKAPMGDLRSDVGCAAELVHAALAACAYNVRINHRYLRETARVRAQAARLVRLEGEASRALTRVRRAVAQSR